MIDREGTAEDRLICASDAVALGSLLRDAVAPGRPRIA